MEEKKYTGKPRGTAGMDAETIKRIARAGGLKTASNRAHMAEIGRRGGKRHSKEHMQKIASLGGHATAKVAREAKKAKEEKT